MSVSVRPLFLWLGLAVFLIESTSVAHAGEMFIGLGELDSETPFSFAHGMSADGSVVVGRSELDGDVVAFRWDETDGMQIVSRFPAAGNGGFVPTPGVGNAASSDGSVIVGSTDGQPFQGFLWTAGEGILRFRSFPSRHRYSSARGVSADGTVVVGYAASDPSGQAFRWTADEGMRKLDLLPGGYDSKANAVSADGAVVVGTGSASGTHDEAFRWTQETGTVGLGFLPGGSSSEALDVSANGEVVVGWSRVGPLVLAFRWTEETGMVAIGDLPGGVEQSTAYATSGDGSIIVGKSWAHRGNEAFIWDAERGMRSIPAILAFLGADLTARHLSEATGISDDGFTISGTGIIFANRPCPRPCQFSEAWIATLPKPPEIDIRPNTDFNAILLVDYGVIPVAILGSKSFDVTGLDPLTFSFGPRGAIGAPPAHSFGAHPSDVNDDGYLDLLSHFIVGETGIELEDTEACLVGESVFRVPFELCDEIYVLNECGLGFELAFVLPVLMWLRKRKTLAIVSSP